MYSLSTYYVHAFMPKNIHAVYNGKNMKINQEAWFYLLWVGGRRNSVDLEQEALGTWHTFVP